MVDLCVQIPIIMAGSVVGTVSLIMLRTWYALMIAIDEATGNVLAFCYERTILHISR